MRHNVRQKRDVTIGRRGYANGARRKRAHMTDSCVLETTGYIYLIIYLYVTFELPLQATMLRCTHSDSRPALLRDH